MTSRLAVVVFAMVTLNTVRHRIRPRPKNSFVAARTTHAAISVRHAVTDLCRKSGNRIAKTRSSSASRVSATATQRTASTIRTSMPKISALTFMATTRAVASALTVNTTREASTARTVLPPIIEIQTLRSHPSMLV